MSEAGSFARVCKITKRKLKKKNLKRESLEKIRS